MSRPQGPVPRGQKHPLRASAGPRVHHIRRPGGHRQCPAPSQREGQAAAPGKRPGQHQVEGDAVEHEPAGCALSGR